MREPAKIIDIPEFLIYSNLPYDSDIKCSCQSCMETCEIYCETGCEVCLNCESSCEKTSCQSSCQTSCQTICEKNTCQTCQDTCQKTCQVCQKCQTECQLSCQTCMTSCQSSGNHSWKYTDWQPNGSSGCQRLKYCGNLPCTSNEIQTKSHSYTTVGTSSVCQRCSDCGYESSSHNMWLTSECTVIDHYNHMTYRKCSTCGYKESWVSESHSFTDITYVTGTETHCSRYMSCPKCKYGYLDQTQAHNFVNNVCTYCGQEKVPFPDYNFEWEYPKVKGQKFKFDSIEYRLLVGYINEKLKAYNKSTISKTTVTDGEIVYASTMNGVLEGLRRLGAYGVPLNVQSKQKVEALFLNKIRDCANSVQKP